MENVIRVGEAKRKYGVTPTWLRQVTTALSSKYAIDVKAGKNWAMNVEKGQLIYVENHLLALDRDTVLGILLHELGHYRHSDNDWHPSIKAFQANPKQFHGYVNVFEDVRINEIMSRSYGGSRELITAMNELIGAGRVKELREASEYIRRNYVLNQEKEIRQVLRMKRVDEILLIGLLKFSGEWKDAYDLNYYDQDVIKLANDCVKLFHTDNIIDANSTGAVAKWVEEKVLPLIGMDWTPPMGGNGKGGDTPNGGKGEEPSDTDDGDGGSGDDGDDGDDSQDDDDSQSGGESMKAIDGEPDADGKSKGGGGGGDDDADPADDGKGKGGDADDDDADDADPADDGKGKGDDDDDDDADPADEGESKSEGDDDADDSKEQSQGGSGQSVVGNKYEEDPLDWKRDLEQKIKTAIMRGRINPDEKFRTKPFVIQRTKQVKSGRINPHMDFDVLEPQVRPLISRFKNDMEVIFKDNRAVREVHRQRAGRLDIRKVSRFFTKQDTRIFKRKAEINQKDYAIAFCTDVSGSMFDMRGITSSRIFGALASLIAFIRTLEALGISYGTGFFGTNFGIGKNFADKHSNNRAQSLGASSAGGNTHLGSLFGELVEKQLMARPEGTKMVIILTDGEWNGDDYVRVAKFAQKHTDVVVYVVGLTLKQFTVDLFKRELGIGKSKNVFLVEAETPEDVMERYLEIARKIIK